MFVDLGYEDKACMRLQNENWEDKFLLSRLIFLTTYGTNVNLLTLIDQHHLADSVIQNLSRHVERATAIPTSEANVDPMEGMALGETLRLLFNVTHFCPQRANSFTPAIPHIITLLCTLDVSSPPLSPPMGSLVNALMNLELDSTTVQTSLFPLSDSNAVVARLVHLLSSSLAFYKETELEQTVTPLVGVIRRLHDLAPEIVKRFVRDSLLPTEQDRQSVLGKGESLSARLLQNTVNPMTPGLRDTISHLFFELSGRDASKLVQNIGYGFAAGYLFQNNIPIPESATDAYDNANSSDGRNPVNPITGQFLESENQPELPEMTGEEKEREAERLFVLFERSAGNPSQEGIAMLTVSIRLKRNGLIQVQNPVAQAVEECRFEELGDDGDEATLIESFNDKQSDIR